MSLPSFLLKRCAPTVLLLQASIAGAQGFLCLPGVSPRRIDGDLNVVTRCELRGTEVRGNVTLFAGGSLTAHDVRIRGKLAGSSADFVDMDGGRVDGDFRLEQMVGDLIRIQGVELRAGVELVGNRSRLEVVDNEIGRDMEVTANVGGVLITGNTLDNLRCADNVPAPLGADNRVSGEAEGQCQDLQLEAPPAVPPTPPPAPTPPPESPPTTPPPTTPPPESPPPVSAPPVSAPPVTAPPSSAPSANFVPDPNGGGGGAMGLSWLLLLPFAAWRRAGSRRRTR